MVFTRVMYPHLASQHNPIHGLCYRWMHQIGIGPKVSQSVITAAFLFALKDLLYEMSVRLRHRVPKVIKKA